MQQSKALWFCCASFFSSETMSYTENITVRVFQIIPQPQITAGPCSYQSITAALLRKIQSISLPWGNAHPTYKQQNPSADSISAVLPLFNIGCFNYTQFSPHCIFYNTAM